MLTSFSVELFEWPRPSGKHIKIINTPGVLDGGNHEGSSQMCGQKNKKKLNPYETYTYNRDSFRLAFAFLQ